MAVITFAPTAITSDNTLGGSIVWTDPGNAAASDDSQATVTGPLTAEPLALTSTTLKCASWQFGGDTIAALIAAGDTINSITLTVERNASGSAAGWYVKDAIVKHFIDGAYGGTNEADTVTLWPGPPNGVEKAYTMDVITTAQLRAAGYAVGLQVTMLPLTDANIVGNVDMVSLAVDYTAVSNAQIHMSDDF